MPIEFAEGVRRIVGAGVALEVCPQSFDRVEFRRVAGEALQGQPGGISLYLVGDDLAAVRGQPVTQDDDRSVHMPPQVAQVVDQGLLIE